MLNCFVVVIIIFFVVLFVVVFIGCMVLDLELVEMLVVEWFVVMLSSELMVVVGLVCRWFGGDGIIFIGELLNVELYLEMYDYGLCEGVNGIVVYVFDGIFVLYVVVFGDYDEVIFEWFCVGLYFLDVLNVVCCGSVYFVDLIF